VGAFMAEEVGEGADAGGGESFRAETGPRG